jgi:hypothetical protein
LYGKDGKWIEPLAKAMGDNVYARQLRRALADDPMATLEPKDFTRLRVLLEQRARMITAALAKFDGVVEADKAAA